MTKILGSTTTYHGTEHSYLKGYRVRIVAVLKNRARPDGGGHNDDYVTDDVDLDRAGGVTADDRIEVQPWMEDEGRFSFVTSDPRAVDLACFRHLAKATRSK